MSKGSPLSSTVSIPRWTRTSSPFSVLSANAWPVLATIMTFPDTGARIFPLFGLEIPSPSPTTFSENMGSGTSSMGMTRPDTGATISTTLSFPVALLCGAVCDVVTSSEGRSEGVSVMCLLPE